MPGIDCSQYVLCNMHTYRLAGRRNERSAVVAELAVDHAVARNHFYLACRA